MLSTYTPQYADLRFRQTMLADEETMAYNHAWGGTIPFPEERWGEWYAHWVKHPEGKRMYRYVRNEEGTFVGEIAYHYDDELPGFTANVIIYAPYRRRGYGGHALDLLCAAAKEGGVTRLYDDIAADNPAIKLFLTHGFAEERRTAEKIYLVKQLSTEEETA